MSHYLLLLLLAISWPSFAGLPIVDSQGEQLPTLAPMLKKASPAVVNISVKSTQVVNNPLMNDPFFRHFFNIPKNHQQQKKSSSAGSGVIINAENGTVMTNYHVIKNADEIIIGLSDGRSFEAKLIGSDPEVDIAILSIDAEDLTALSIADSNQLEVGDFVVAIGNPFGLGQTVTTGIISALERTGLGIEGYENFIQTDASINPGNSGGALVNLRGELVGINTAIIAPSGGNVGIGFAIPTNMAMLSKEQIIKHGEVKRGKLGIYIQDLNPELAEAFDLDKQQKGVLITNVEDGSSAEKAGIIAEDIIIAVNGQATKTAASLRNAIGLRPIGETIKVTLLRNGKKKKLNVKIEARGEVATNGVKGSALPPKLEGLELQSTQDGLLVTGITPQSPAINSGLRTKDLIIAVNRIRVQNIEDIHKASKKKKGFTLLQVIRNGTTLFLVVR
jgi:Do/DeqQ family serine protease